MNDASAIKAEILFSEVVGKYVPLKYERGEHWGLCPFHDERTPSFAVDDNKGKYYCQGCGAGGDVFNFIQRIQNTNFKGAKEFLSGQNYEKFSPLSTAEKPAKFNPAPIPDKNRYKALIIWHETDPAQGTLAEVYLRSRGITIPVPPTIRYHPNLKHYGTGLNFPALVAAVSDQNKKLIAIQRIYLRTDGRGKANVSAPKMALGPIKGGAVRLSPLKDILVLTEGIEDGLTILQGRPEFGVWATLGTQNLTSQKIPDTIKRLIIGADNDTAGEKAAKDAASYYAARGFTVSIAKPLAGFKDFNEQLQKSGIAA